MSRLEIQVIWFPTFLILGLGSFYALFIRLFRILSSSRNYVAGFCPVSGPDWLCQLYCRNLTRGNSPCRAVSDDLAVPAVL